MNKVISCDFEKNVKLKNFEFSCTKDTEGKYMRNYLENNLLLPDYYGYDEEDRMVFADGISELIFNSIRAAAEEDKDHPITLRIKYSPDIINIEITNGAGGFDFDKVPFVPDRPFDILSFKASEYHEEAGRGGMGMYMASNIFRNFKLGFIDRDGDPCEFNKGITFGTKVTMDIFKK